MGPALYLGHCSPNCRCRCHDTSLSIARLVFNSLFGRSQPRVECTESSCKHLQRVTFPVLRSFKQITAEVWIEGQSLTHFSLRMPRVVGQKDLIWLQDASLEAIRQKLWSRELTVTDVDPDGQSVLHVSAPIFDRRAVIHRLRLQTVTWRLMVDRSDAVLSIIALLTEHSAPTDWEFDGL